LLRCFPPSDVVIATFWTTAHDYLEELGRRGDALSIYFVQDYEAYFYPEGDVETRNRVMASYGLAERRIVKSRWLCDLIESRHGQRCEIVPLGLDLGIFRPRAASPGGRGRPRVVSVARPRDRRRGFAELVAAFRSIHQRRPDIELVCFGTPTEAMPADLGFPYLCLGNVADQNDVAALLSSCDVLIDPSLFQAFGRPGLEAMACGTNCVLTSEGGISEYARHEENCLLVTPGDPRGLADAALRLLGDPVLRDRLRQAGMATAQRFSHVAEAERHLELYRGWLAERTCRTVPSGTEPSLALRRAAAARGASARPAPEPIA
jgi:glycosyltransferase involved in cell wall biosynthesis